MKINDRVNLADAHDVPVRNEGTIVGFYEKPYPPGKSDKGIVPIIRFVVVQLDRGISAPDRNLFTDTISVHPSNIELL